MSACPLPVFADDAEAPTGAASVEEIHYRGEAVEVRRASLADEVPVAFEYNGVSHAVMLATPADLEDFAFGFSLTEGIAREPAEIYGVEAHRCAQGITLAIELASEAFVRLKQRRRTLVGRTGCGICGSESLDQVIRPLPALAGRGPRIRPAAVTGALDALVRSQSLQKRTGAVHGAAWSLVHGSAQIVREDVGRHNALDKLVGALVRTGFDSRSGFAVVTSRASVEMVQKAACISTLLAAVSAPTRLATQVAHDCGLTLVGFARGKEFSVYTHAWRIAAATE